MELEHIKLFHEYRRLARRDFVPPLTHACGSEYSIVLRMDAFLLKCFGCGATVDPGVAMLKEMNAAIKDYEAKR